MTGRVLAFARSLLSRHRRRHVRASTVEARLLRARTAPRVLQRHEHRHHSSHVTVAPRMFVTVSSVRPVGAVATPAVIDRRRGAPTIPVPPATGTAPRDVERVLLRVIRRSERVEVTRPLTRVLHGRTARGDPPPAAADRHVTHAQASERQAPQPSVPVREAQRLVAPPGAKPVAHRPSAPAQPTASATPAAQVVRPAAPPAPVDVADLTERVLHDINRRIVAERERLGS